MKELGCVYLVGAGPGDEGLLTVRGARLLSCCGCVVYDHLASERLLNYVSADCERIFVGKQKGRHSRKQEEINEILIEKAYQYAVVVRLKGGDPYVFGRGGEEAMALGAAGIPYEVVPGVTSAVAVPESAGIPITHRQISRSFHVITGHTKADGGLPDDFYCLGDCKGTAVFLMGVSQLGAISRGLIDQGWDRATPAAVIQNGTLPTQREVRGTLENIEKRAREAGIGTPAVIVAGEAAGLQLLSKEKRPLEGIRIGVTGTDGFTNRLKSKLESWGARVTVVCRIQIVPIESREVLDSYDRLEEYTWLVFTSGNGVRLYLDGLLGDEAAEGDGCRPRDLRCLGGVKLAAIGKGTEEALRAYHLRADYVPAVFSSRELALGLAERLSQEDQVLIPRALQGSKELTEILGQSGIHFHNLPIYDVKAVEESDQKISVREGADKEMAGREESDREMPDRKGQKGQAESFDFLVFASASGVNAFFETRRTVGQAKLCCIGEATAKALERYGYQADCVAGEASAGGIAKGILELVQEA